MNKLGIASFLGAFFISKIFRKGVEDMDVIYASLIVSGLKTYAQVPKIMKEKVKVILVELGLEELVTE